MFVCHSHHHSNKGYTKANKGYTQSYRTWKYGNLRKNTLYDSQAIREHKQTHKIGTRTGASPIEQWLVTLSTQGKIPYVRYQSNEWHNHIRACVKAAYNHRSGIDHWLTQYKNYCARKRVAHNVDESSLKVEEVSIRVFLILRVIIN